MKNADRFRTESTLSLKPVHTLQEYLRWGLIGVAALTALGVAALLVGQLEVNTIKQQLAQSLAHGAAASANTAQSEPIIQRLQQGGDLSENLEPTAAGGSAY